MNTDLSYRQRMETFGRWILPVARKEHGTSHLAGEPVDNDLISPSLETLKTIHEALRTLEQPGVLHTPGSRIPVTPSETASWTTETEVRVSASVGHVLHGLEQNPKYPAMTYTDIIGAATGPRCFSYAVPGLIPLVANADFPRNDAGSRNLVLHFCPSPWVHQRSDALSSSPLLSMHFLTHPMTQNLSVRKLVSRIKRVEVDVMLPDRAADMRIVLGQAVVAKPNFVDDPEVQNFIDQFRERSTRGGQIRAPPTLRLRIPSWMVRNPLEAGGKSSPVESSDGQVAVEYALYGMEDRTYVNAEFEGYQLCYLNVDRGKIGSHGARLRLQPDKKAHANVKDFVKKAFKFSKLVNDAALGHLPMPTYLDEVRSRADDSRPGPRQHRIVTAMS